METNHDGEIDHPCSGLGAARPAGVSRKSGVPVRTNIRRDSDRRAAIEFPAVPAILVTIDHRATRDHPAAIRTRAIRIVPVTTDHRWSIGLRVAVGTPAVQGSGVTMGRRWPIGLRAAIGRRTDLDVPANTGRSCPR